MSQRVETFSSCISRQSMELLVVQRKFQNVKFDADVSVMFALKFVTLSRLNEQFVKNSES